jgi:hypothetical protein
MVNGPGSHPERRTVAVLYGYFDGSGTHDGAKVCAIAGFVGEVAAFENLHDRWKIILEDPRWPTRLKEFHTVDCVNQEGEFARWSYAERLAIFGSMATAIVEAEGLLAIGSAVLCVPLLGLSATDLSLLQSQGLGTPTDLTFQHLVQRIVNRTHEYDEHEKVGLIFDEEPAARAERYHALFDHYRSNYPVKGHLAGIAFASSEDFTPLQAADLLAYTTMRWTTELAYPETVEPWFPITPAFLRMIQGVNADGGSYDAEALNGLINKIKRGETMT